MKLFIMLLAMMSTVNLATAEAREKAGNGGNAIASEFSRIAGNAATALLQVCRVNPEEYACKNQPLLQRAVDRATILVKDQVFGADGVERDATNDGDFKIEIGKIRWNDKGMTPEKKLSLAVHEHLSLLKVEGSDQYGESNEIVSTLVRHEWTVADLLSGTTGVKTFSDMQLTVVSDGKLFRISETMDNMGHDLTSAFGFCVFHGFKTLRSKNWEFVEATNVSVTLPTISFDAYGKPTESHQSNGYYTSIICSM